MKNFHDIFNRIIKIEEYIESSVLSSKEVLNLEEASKFSKMSKSQLYKLTSGRKVIHYKRGKLIYFRRSELVDWLLEDRQSVMADD